MSKVIAVGFRICFDLPPKKKAPCDVFVQGRENLRYFMGFHGTQKGNLPVFPDVWGYVVKDDQSQGCTLGEFCAWEDEEVWCSSGFPCNIPDISSRYIQICSTLYLGVELSLKMKHEEKKHHV